MSPRPVQVERFEDSTSDVQDLLAGITGHTAFNATHHGHLPVKRWQPDAMAQLQTKKTGNGTAYEVYVHHRTSSYIIVHHRTSSYIIVHHRTSKWDHIGDGVMWAMSNFIMCQKVLGVVERGVLVLCFWIVCCQLSSFNSPVYFPGLAKTAFHFGKCSCIFLARMPNFCKSTWPSLLMLGYNLLHETWTCSVRLQMNAWN